MTLPIVRTKLGKQAADLTGRQFGKWTVLAFAGKRNSLIFWTCRCQCGTIKDVYGSSLKNGASKTCGCGIVAATIRRSTKHGMACRGRLKVEYQTWSGMKDRCRNKNHAEYPIYGGRGIVVCERWLNSFGNFFADMGPRPSPRHSIDRIDNDGNYEPTNCRWATPIEQANNKRNNRMLSLDGETRTLPDWARLLGVSSHVLHQRLHRGWSVERTLRTKVKKK